MHCLFIPTLGLDLSLLDRLAASVDYPVSRKVIFNNGLPGACDPFRDTHPDWIVKESDTGNKGVADSWNMCAKMFPEHPTWLIMNDDAWFLPGYLEKICKCADAHETEPIIHLNSSNPYYAFVWTARGKREFGEFDANYFPAYCLAPETLVLTIDLRWVEIGSLKPGDKLVGVEEHPPPTHSRKYLPSEVISTGRRFAPCVRIGFEDGREVICTTDHKWLTKFHRTPMTWKSGGILWQWRTTNQMKPGMRVYAPLRTWTTDTTFDGGWLSGIFDGEGNLRSSKDMRGVSFSQKGGHVLDNAIRILKNMGIRYTISKKTDRKNTAGTRILDDVFSVDVSIRQEAIELMGRIRPVRLMPKQMGLWENSFIRSKNANSDLAIRFIEPIGMSEVVTISTTSKTFIANGIVSHNCEDCDMRVRHRLMGYNGYVYALEGLEPLPHGKPKTGGVNYNAMIQGCGLLNRQYWLRKWGSLDFEKATYQNPYKDHRLTPSEWVYYVEERIQRRVLWDAFMNLPNPSIYE